MSIYTEINCPTSLQTASRVMEPAGILAALAEVGGDEGLQAALSEELRLLLACPQVRPPSASAKVFFNADKHLPPAQQRPQERGVRFSLLCCKQATKRCNAKQGDAACPTFVEATRFVRQIVLEKHRGEACLERAAAARIAEGLDAAPPAAAAPKNAFELLAAGQLAQQKASSATHQLRKDLALAALEEKQAGQKRVALEGQLAACESTLRPPSKQRRSSSSAGSSTFELDLTERRLSVQTAAPLQQASWMSWDLETWRRLESWAHNRRQTELTHDQPLDQPARGPLRGVREGPLDHERRGLIGTIQDWACGSRHEAAHLIAQVVQRLDLKVRASSTSSLCKHVC